MPIYASVFFQCCRLCWRSVRFNVSYSGSSRAASFVAFYFRMIRINAEYIIEIHSNISVYYKSSGAVWQRFLYVYNKKSNDAMSRAAWSWHSIEWGIHLTRTSKERLLWHWTESCRGQRGERKCELSFYSTGKIMIQWIHITRAVITRSFLWDHYIWKRKQIH
jgi:hypothetical protein